MISSIHRNSQSWSELPWKKFQKHLAGLQLRVSKATQEGDERKVKSLQKLLIHSSSARYLAIKLVSEKNLGPYSQGQVNKIILTHQEKHILERKLRTEVLNWRPSRKRSFFLTKSRANRISVNLNKIADLVWQCLIGFALQPTYRNYTPSFQENSSKHTSQRWFKEYFSNLVKNHYHKVLVFNFKVAKIRTNPTSLMSVVNLPKSLKLGVFRFLQTGLKPTLNLLEPASTSSLSESLSECVWSELNKQIPVVGTNSQLLIFLRKDQIGYEYVKRIDRFLASNGIFISKKESFITSSRDGIDYYWWHLRQTKSGNIQYQPSKISYRAFHKSVKAILLNPSIGVNLKSKIISNLVCTWRQTHKYCKLRGIFSLFKLKNQVWKKFNTKRRTQQITKALVDEAFPVSCY
nr:hypothetical protein [Proteomonas sp. NIES-1005]